MKNVSLAILIISFLLLPFMSKATHVGGGYFSYQCINASTNTYQFTYTFWRDCTGLVSAPLNYQMDLNSNCGNSSIYLLLQSNSTVEVSQLCSTQLPNSSCNGGSLPGYTEYVYTGTASLNANCQVWNMSLGISSRNSATNLIGQQTAYFYGNIQNNGVCNNSPIFTSQPIPYYCVGQQVQFNPGVQETDGDSLVYNIVSPSVSQVTTANYANGFSSATPFGSGSPITFDSQTGQLSFVPNLVGNFVLVYEVCEYRNGVSLGCVMREFQMVIQSCNNETPYMPIGMQNFVGTGTILDSNSIVACIGDSFSFDVVFQDSLIANQTIGDSITISTNVASVLSGSNISITNGNPATLHVEWTTSMASPPFSNFIIEVADDACPIPGIGIYQFDITVIPDKFAGANQTICGYQDTAFVNLYDGGEYYTWSVLSGDTMSLGVNITDTTGNNADSVWLYPRHTTTYLIESSQITQCVLYDTLTVFVNNIDAGSDTVLCVGDTFTLGHQITGQNQCPGSQGSYTWFPTVGLSDSTIQNPLLTVQPNQSSTMYKVVFDNGCGCTMIDSFWVEVNTMIEPNTSISKLQCGVDDGQIEVFPQSGYAPYMYSVDSGANFSNSSIFDSLPVDVYGVMIIDSVGCMSPVKMDTILDPNAPIIDSIWFQNSLCNSGNSGYIQVYASGGLAPYEYSIDSSITYVDSSLLSGLYMGDYWVSVRDSLGCRSLMDSVHIDQPQQLALDLDLENDTCFQACGGSAVAQVSGGVTPYNYNWLGFGTNDSSSFNLCSGSYNLIVTDSHNCVIDTTFYINEPAELVFDSVEVKDVTCYNGTDGYINLQVSGAVPPYRYSIDGGVTTQATPYFSSLPSNAYDVVVYDSGYRCMASITVNLTQPAETMVETPITYKKLCVSNCVNLTASASGGNGTPYSFHWSGGVAIDSSSVSVCPTSDTLYTVYSSDSLGCASQPIIVEVEFYDSLQMHLPSSISKCEMDTLQLEVIPSGGNPNSGYTYNWNPKLDITNPYLQSPMVFPKSTREYIVELNDGCGSSSIFDTILVVVIPDPEPTFQHITSRTGCEPFTVEFQNTTDSAQFIKWWLNNDYTGSGTNYRIEELEAGSYNLKMEVEDINGCVGESEWTNYVIVNPLPHVDFTMSPNPTTVYTPRIQFVNLSSGRIRSYQWDFAGYDSSSVVSPFYKFPQESGLYPVTLIATTDSGCIDSFTQELTIEEEYNIYTPNSFTPNDDALNDEFKPNGIGIDPLEYVMRIYDRWGRLVFETHDINQGWNGSGTEKNQQNNLGSYAWVIELRDVTNPDILKTYRGTVHLLR